MKNLKSFVILCIALMLQFTEVSIARSESSNKTNQGAIGGTGISSHEGGIGGTGIVGMITGFGSIFVNGLEVHYSKDLAITINGKAGQLKDLAVGQVVSLSSSVNESGLITKDIKLLNALEGPITKSLKNGVIEVMGQNVYINQMTHFSAKDEPDNLKVGTLVQVSGYKNSNREVLASRIHVSKNLQEFSAIGHINLKSDGELTLDGIKIEDRNRMLIDAKDDRELLVYGSWDGTKLAISQFEVSPGARVAEESTRIVVEGFVHKDLKNGYVLINGLEIHAHSESNSSTNELFRLFENQLIRITGHVEQHNVVEAESIETNPSRVEGRQELNENQESGKSIHQDDKNHGNNSSHSFDSPSNIEKDETNQHESIEHPEKIDRPEQIDKPDLTDKPEPISSD